MGDQRREDLSDSEKHHVLSNKRRQLALRYLFENGGSVKLDTLSEHIAVEETDESPPPRNKRNSVYSSLHQSHLPQLSSLNVIRYNTDTNEIKLGEQANELKPYLEREVVKTKLKSISFIALGVFGVSSITGSLLEIFPFSLVHPLLLLGVFLVSAGLMVANEVIGLHSPFED